MNYSKLTRDELEAEAQREETPELIEELSKRVWEAQGNCAHRSETTWERNDGEMFLRCENKECLTLKDIPDITDPAVFWPLVVKGRIQINIYETDGLLSYKAHPMYDNSPDARSWSTEPGIAVALAYLKIKEMEDV